MTERRPSFADILDPSQIRQYMAEAGYVQQEPVSAPTPPAPQGIYAPPQPPAELVEFRGTIEFQAHWERPAIMGRSREDLVADIMGSMAGQEAAWLPRIRYHVVSLAPIDPNARAAAAVDQRIVWKHPTTGTLWRVNPNGSLEAASQAPPISTPDGWLAEESRIPPAARKEMQFAMREMVREEQQHDGRLDGLEKLAYQLRSQLADMEANRTSRREARRQRRVHRGDVPENGHGDSSLPDSPLREEGGDPGGSATGHGSGADGLVPGDDGGGIITDRGIQRARQQATPDRDARGADRPKRKSPVPRVVDVSLTEERTYDEVASLSEPE